MWTEATKNTIVGVMLSAIMAGIVWMITETNDAGKHLAKIDVVLGQQDRILQDIYQKSGSIPPRVEDKLEELRNRMNNQDTRIAEMDKNIILNAREVGTLKESLAKK